MIVKELLARTTCHLQNMIKCKLYALRIIKISVKIPHTKQRSRSMPKPEEGGH